MGLVLAFMIGALFGIILMGLCVASSEQSRKDQNKDDNNTCHIDKE